MWFMLLFVLSTGQKLEYKTTFETSAACVAARPAVIAKLLKDNPTVTRQQFDKDYVLYCTRNKQDDPKK